MFRGRVIVVAVAFAGVLVVGVPARADAQGCCALPLGVFTWSAWSVYLVLCIILETWLLRRWLACSFRVSMWTGVCSNIVTGLAVPTVVGYVGGERWAMVGSRLNPNPVASAALLLLAYVAGSSAVKAVAWSLVRARQACSAPQGARTPRGAAGLMLLGAAPLLVVLLPDRPYPGIEATARVERFELLNPSVGLYLQREARDYDRLPSAATYVEMLDTLHSGWWQARRNEPDHWCRGYLPLYRRFDTSESRRQPVEWNVRLPRAGFRQLRASTVWLVRMRDETYGATGLVMDVPDCTVRYGRNDTELGYDR